MCFFWPSTPKVVCIMFRGRAREGREPPPQKHYYYFHAVLKEEKENKNNTGRGGGRARKKNNKGPGEASHYLFACFLLRLLFRYSCIRTKGDTIGGKVAFRRLCSARQEIVFQQSRVLRHKGLIRLRAR